MAKGGKKCSRSSPKKPGREVAESIGKVRRDQEWVKSTTTQKILEGMVFEGVLHDQATTGWRPAAGEPFPTPDTSELVVFVAYFVRGFGIPTHPFLQKFLVTIALACAISIPTVSFISPSSLICAKHSSKSLHTSFFFAISSASNPFMDLGPPKWSVVFIYNCLLA